MAAKLDCLETFSLSLSVLWGLWCKNLQMKNGTKRDFFFRHSIYEDAKYCTGPLEFWSWGTQDALIAKTNADTACKRVSFRDTVISCLSLFYLKVASCWICLLMSECLGLQVSAHCSVSMIMDQWDSWKNLNTIPVVLSHMLQVRKLI